MKVAAQDSIMPNRLKLLNLRLLYIATQSRKMIAHTHQFLRTVHQSEPSGSVSYGNTANRLVLLVVENFALCFRESAWHYVQQLQNSTRVLCRILGRVRQQLRVVPLADSPAGQRRMLR